MYGVAEGQGFEPWRAVKPCRFSLPAMVFTTKNMLNMPCLGSGLCLHRGLEKALGGSRQVSTRSAVLNKNGSFARRYLSTG